MSEIEHHLATLAARAGLRLRFDKVALRVTRTLQNNLRGFMPGGEAILFTITAPIRQPSKTVMAIEARVRDSQLGARIEDAICGNGVRVRRIGDLTCHTLNVLGFVHNRESDAEALLDLAQSQLTGSHD